MDQPLGITDTELKKMTDKWAGNTAFASGRGNNRNIKNLEGRAVKKGGVECEE